MRSPLALLVLALALPSSAALADCDEVLDDALAAILMTRADLCFRTDYADQPDSFRLAAVDSLLRRPLDTEHFVADFAAKAQAAGSLGDLVSTCARHLDLDTTGERPAPLPDGARAEQEAGGPSALDLLLPTLAETKEQMRLAFSNLSDEEIEFLQQYAWVLLEEEEYDPEKPIEEREREAEKEEELGDELLRIAGRVDRARIARAGAVLAAAVDDAIPLVLKEAKEAEAGSASAAHAEGDVVRAISTTLGPVAIGGPGPTHYTGAWAAIIDLGGDDTYDGDVAGATWERPAAIVIDAGGDDQYRSADFSLGGGFMGVGILADLGGDDSYSAGSFSLGSGLFGVGILLDRDGDDRYAGDTCTEGSGAFGMGLHVDRNGNDSYNAALFSQAFGFVGGLGLLLDGSGNDRYDAGGKYTDEIRYFDHFLSLSQGFGFGWRPDASGGIGILIDESGNDVYVSDIFGQGSSYWFAVGGLVDLDGNDRYVSYQYAQGAGTHITLAALLDLAGDDNYVSKGVSQGCGHDLALGLLHDMAGDDNYVCHDLSQGAGNANGIGILMDNEGDDAYSVRNPTNTNGYGNLRRDYGSVGLFLDCGGADAYSGRGSDGTWWTGSSYGIGIDTESDERAIR